VTIVTALLGRTSPIRDSADSNSKSEKLVFIFICKRLYRHGQREMLLFVDRLSRVSLALILART